MNNFDFINYVDGDIELSIQISKEDNIAFLSIEQLTKLFQKDRTVISRHIKNIFAKHMLDKESNVHFLHIASSDKPVAFYSMDVVINLGYIIQSDKGLKLQRFLTEYLRKNDNTLLNNIIIYNNGGLNLSVSVSPNEETVWLTSEQVALLYGTSKQVVSYHVNNILADGELERATVKEILTVQIENNRNVNRSIVHYNLEMILSIGYRINSRKGIEFRRWANRVLKQYLLKGYAIDDNRVTISKENFIQLENNVKQIKDEIVDIKEKTFIEPVKERLFYDGQYFDAYEFLVSLVANANNSILLIDPYFDIKGLNIIKRAKREVKVTICLSLRSTLLDADVVEFKKQYSSLDVILNNKFHDRFLIIDEKECYALGTSLNYVGKRVFAINRIEDEDIINAIIKKAIKQ